MHRCGGANHTFGEYFAMPQHSHLNTTPAATLNGTTWDICEQKIPLFLPAFAVFSWMILFHQQELSQTSLKAGGGGGWYQRYPHQCPGGKWLWKYTVVSPPPTMLVQQLAPECRDTQGLPKLRQLGASSSQSSVQTHRLKFLSVSGVLTE